MKLKQKIIAILVQDYMREVTARKILSLINYETGSALRLLFCVRNGKADVETPPKAKRKQPGIEKR